MSNGSKFNVGEFVIQFQSVLQVPEIRNSKKRTQFRKLGICSWYSNDRTTHEKEESKMDTFLSPKSPKELQMMEEEKKLFLEKTKKLKCKEWNLDESPLELLEPFKTAVLIEYKNDSYKRYIRTEECLKLLEKHQKNRDVLVPRITMFDEKDIQFITEYQKDNPNWNLISESKKKEYKVYKLFTYDPEFKQVIFFMKCVKYPDDGMSQQLSLKQKDKSEKTVKAMPVFDFGCIKVTYIFNNNIVAKTGRLILLLRGKTKFDQIIIISSSEKIDWQKTMIERGKTFLPSLKSSIESSKCKIIEMKQKYLELKDEKPKDVLGMMLYNLDIDTLVLEDSGSLESDDSSMTETTFIYESTSSGLSSETIAGVHSEDIDTIPKIWGNDLSRAKYNIFLGNYYQNGIVREEKGSTSKYCLEKNQVDFILEDGYLIVMVDRCHEIYQHCIVKNECISTGRINLTFGSFESKRYQIFDEY
eukprot:gene4-4255_t